MTIYTKPVIVRLMRLSNIHKDIIEKTLTSHFSDAEIYLFGSRADDSKRGGDIDLIMNTSHEFSMKDKIILLTLLEKEGIHRKIDLIVRTPERPHERLYKEVIEKGIRLW